jgi:ankyrin repeat domain-containing protein 50
MATLSYGLSNLHMNKSPTRALEASEEEMNDCIRSLYLADYATRLDEIQAREPGTCEWILNHRNFHKWADSDSSALLWLSGNPGCGKTVISSFLIESFRKQSNVTVVYFICDNRHEHFRTKESVLRSLLHQLFVSNPFLVRHALPHFKSMKDSMATSAATLWAIFKDIVKDDDFPVVYCILDALDECEDDSRKWILGTVGQLFSVNEGSDLQSFSAAGAFKMLVTSRPWEDIEFGFRPTSSIRLKTEHEDRINHDINIFIKKQVNSLAQRRGYSAKVQSIIKETLSERASGMFLWVSLIVRDLEGIPTSRVQSRLDALPRTLYELYERILVKVNPSAADRVRHILMWTVTAIRPFSLEELAIACEFQESSESSRMNMDELVQSIKGDIGLCGPILNIRKGRVNLIHQSAKDFLLRENDSLPIEPHSNFRIKPAEAHAILMRQCLKYLSSDEFDIGPLPIPAVYKDPDLFHTHMEKCAFLGYSTKYWPEHFLHSTKLEQVSLKSIRDFFQLSENSAAWFQIFFFLNEGHYGKCPLGGTALHFATYLGNISIMEMLLEQEQTEIDAEDDDGSTPLVWSIKYPLDLADELLSERDIVAQFLIEAGATINTEYGSLGGSPLHCAAIYGKERMAEILVEAGADVDAQDCRGSTPLHDAALYSHNGPRIPEILLENGASVNTVNNAGQTALHVVIDSWEDEDAASSIMLRLLEAGADGDVEDAEGMTPLFLALERSELGAVALLLRYGVGTEGTNPEGKTALHLAAETGNESLAQVLLASGTNVEARDHSGKTAIEIAAASGHKAILNEITRRIITD